MPTIVGHKKLAADLGLEEVDVIAYAKKMKKTKIGYVKSGSGQGFICDKDSFVDQLGSLSAAANATYLKRKKRGKEAAEKYWNSAAGKAKKRAAAANKKDS